MEGLGVELAGGRRTITLQNNFTSCLCGPAGPPCERCRLSNFRHFLTPLFVLSLFLPSSLSACFSSPHVISRTASCDFMMLSTNRLGPRN